MSEETLSAVYNPVGYSYVPLSFYENLKEQGKPLRSQILFARSPEDFYLRLFYSEDSDELADIRDIMDVYFEVVVSSNGSLIEPPKMKCVNNEHMAIGLPVAVYIEKDEAFYRAFILTVQPDRCECCFIDLGFTELVCRSHICYLPEALLQVDAIAVHCNLANVAPPSATPSSYPSACCSEMITLSHSHVGEQALLKENPLMCKVVGVLPAEPADFASAWKYHRDLGITLIVELNMPNHEISIATTPNGFAKLLASMEYCSYSEKIDVFSITTKKSGSSGKKSKRSKQSHSNSLVYQQPPSLPARGRGRALSTISDVELASLPFD